MGEIGMMEELILSTIETKFKQLKLLDLVPIFDDFTRSWMLATSKNPPIPNDIVHFRKQHQDIFESDQKSVELVISRLQNDPYTKQKFPDRNTIFTELIKSEKDCISFDYRLKSIYKTSPHFIHQLNFKNQHGYIVEQKIFHVPRFYDVLRSVYIDLSLPKNCVACSAIFLGGTSLAETFHNQPTTLNINVSQSQTSQDCLRVYVHIYSFVPCYKKYHIKASTNNILIKHTWLREIMDIEFLPIQTEVSLLTEFRRIALLDKAPPPLMMNGWPFLMPFSVTLHKSPTPTNTIIKQRVIKQSEIIETEIDDLTFIFPSGTTININ
jgi:hypothetical protein